MVQTRSKSPKQVTTGGKSRPPARQVQQSAQKRSDAAKRGAAARKQVVQG